MWGGSLCERVGSEVSTQCDHPQKLAEGGMRKQAGGGEGLVDRGRSVRTTPWLPTGLLASLFPVCVHLQYRKLEGIKLNKLSADCVTGIREQSEDCFINPTSICKLG